MHETTSSQIPFVKLKPGKEKTILRFHHWVFSGAIERTTPIPTLGSLVHVVDNKGHLLGSGFWEGGGISVKMLSFGHEIHNVVAFLRQRIEDAISLRCQMNLLRDNSHTTPNNIVRLVYGEADFLPGLIIDLYGHTAVVQAHAAGIYRYIHEIADILRQQQMVAIHAVLDKSSATLPQEVVPVGGDRYICGSRFEEPLFENGLRFIADFERGQKTSFFIDQRTNRSLVERYAKDRKVLNTFCYTGGFSVYALLGGAAQVSSLDSSQRALDVATATLALNFDTDRLADHRTICSDAFEYLHSLHGDEYDMIILDPPAFAKKRSNVKNAISGYRKLNAIALKKIAPGGLLFTFSCSQLVTPYDFRMAILTAAVESGRKIRILALLGQSEDHPIALYHPETEYLKGLLLAVE